MEGMLSVVELAARNEAERRELALLREWYLLPREQRRVETPGRPNEWRLETTCTCPVEWLQTEEGAAKILTLTRMLGRIPFDAFPTIDEDPGAPQPEAVPADEEEDPWVC